MAETEYPIEELIRKNRSYRRFHQDHKIDEQTLRELVNLARLSASGGNQQPLKFILSCEPQKNAKIFDTLAWAGSLPDWDGPAEGERPSAYVVVLLDTEIRGSAGADHGIACQSILLGAVERGLGGCMLGSIKRETLRKALDISDRYEILLVVALGKPKETVVLEESKGDTTYYRDENDVHHVPKRPLDEIIIS